VILYTSLSSWYWLLCDRRCSYATSERVIDEMGAVASGLTEGIDLASTALHYVVRGVCVCVGVGDNIVARAKQL
jgi:hypothetical protein